MRHDQKSLTSDLTIWEIGPYHSALPAPMRLKLSLDGELISSCQVETGFLHRGLEKTMESHSWKSLIAFADHLDPEAAFFGEWVVCLAIEELAEIVVPKRAQWIRIILAELTRISCHLGYILRIAKSVGSETIVHYLLRDRERILDLFELLTGARFSLNFLRLGGVSANLTDGLIERILEFCRIICIRIEEYNDLFTFNYSFLQRSVALGVLSTDLIQAYGVTGPNARASGIGYDVRKEVNTLGYEAFDFEVSVGRMSLGRAPFDPSRSLVLGDVHDRLVLRMSEIAQSMTILKQATHQIPAGDFMNDAPEVVQIPSGEAYCRVETPRGLLGCHLVSDGKNHPNRVQFRPPTLSHLGVVPALLSGTRVADLAVVLTSLDLGIAEADR